MTSTGRFRVYSASAGSGKTFQLTVEYLKFALRDPEKNYRRILAITFTKKATQEMKSRILEACKAFATFGEGQEIDGRNESLFEKVVEVTGYTPEEVAKRAHTVYRHILHNYSDFAVSTIDSFNQRIIRAFAYELKIPINYEVQLNVEETLNIITDRLVSLVGEDKAITKLLMHFFEQKLTKDDSVNIRTDVFESSKIITRDDSKEHIDRLYKYSSDEVQKVGQRLYKAVNQLENELKFLSQRALDIIYTEGLSVGDFSGKGRSFANTFNKQIKGDFKITKTFVDSVSGDKKWFSGKDQDKISGNARAEIRNIGQQIISLSEKHATVQAINKNYPKLAMIVHLFRLYKAYQQEEDVLLISETNQLISKEVKSQPAPFIYEKLGEKYQYFLIDEFQDTSVMQWHNMVPLVVESLMAETGESLVVGDGKQSIYRFRGGEIEQLSKLPELLNADENPYLQEYEGILQQHHKNINLEYNYRSKEMIVAFNNMLFEFIHGHTDLVDIADVYDNFSQKIFHQNSGGYVKLSCGTAPKRGDKEGQQEYLENRLSEIIWTIKDALERGYSYKHIAILSRNNKELADVSTYLSMADIPSVSSESMAILNDTVVASFPLIYQIFLHQEDQVAQLTFATRLAQFGVISVEAHELNKAIAKAECKSVVDFAKLLKGYNDKINFEAFFKLPLLESWELYLSLIDEQYIRPEYTGFFRDHLFQFTTLNGNDFENFVQWWEVNSPRMYIKIGDNIDGVKLITIHKSKGLEFEIVLMPFTNWELKKTESEWVHIDEEAFQPMDTIYFNLNRDFEEMPPPLSIKYAEKLRKVMLDNLNALYVATTRPVAEMYIFSDFIKADSKKYPTLYKMPNIAYLISRFVESREEVVADETVLTFGTKTFPEADKKNAGFHLVLKSDEETGKTADIQVKTRSSTIWNDEVKDKIEQGTIIHALMERIRTVDDIEKSVEEAVTYGWLQKDEQAHFVSLVHKLVIHKQLNDYFDAKVNILSEQSLLDENGREYIPDRLMLTEQKEVKILDFKSGKHSPKYNKQLDKYAEILSKMGYTVVEKIIVLLDPLEIINVA